MNYKANIIFLSESKKIYVIKEVDTSNMSKK